MRPINHSLTETSKTGGPQLGRAEKYWKWLVILSLVLAICGLAWGISARRSNGNDLNNVKVIEQKVSRHMILPTNEQPALATITDHTKLQTPFLKQTQDGDKLLIYQKNKKVIIYRPSVDRIVDTGPIEIDSLPANQSN